MFDIDTVNVFSIHSFVSWYSAFFFNLYSEADFCTDMSMEKLISFLSFIANLETNEQFQSSMNCPFQTVWQQHDTASQRSYIIKNWIQNKILFLNRRKIK